MPFDSVARRSTRPAVTFLGRPAVLGVAALLLGAAIGGALVSLTFPWMRVSSTPSNSGAFADGPTFHQALAKLNGSVNSTAGGPWTLFSAFGWAATAESVPGALGFSFQNNLSLKYCGPEFDGLTIWNGSGYPVFDGNISSGTAPFWQFEWVSGAAQQILVGTIVNWTARTYAPISFSSPCAQHSSMANASTEYESWMNPTPIDTSIQADSAARALGYSYAAKHPAFAEMYNLGWTPFSDGVNHGGNGAGFGVVYTRCGVVGASGFQPEDVVGENATGQVSNTFVGLLTCSPNAGTIPGPYVPQPYELKFWSPGHSIAAGPNTSAIAIPFDVWFPAPNGTPGDTDGWGLVAWELTVSLNNSTDWLPTTAATCQAWVPLLDECSANPTGVSVVLLSANGSWLDTYPSPSGSGWAVPNVLVVGGESMVVLAPSSWVFSGDSISFSGSGPIPPVVNSTCRL